MPVPKSMRSRISRKSAKNWRNGTCISDTFPPWCGEKVPWSGGGGAIPSPGLRPPSPRFRGARELAKRRQSSPVDHNRLDAIAALGLIDDRVHPVGDAAEDRVAAVEMRLGRVRDEELRPARVGTRKSHAERAAR